MSFLRQIRVVGRSENPGVPVGGDNLSPLVEIGLTDLPKSGCAMAHPAHPGTAGLKSKVEILQNFVAFSEYLYELYLEGSSGGHGR